MRKLDTRNQIEKEAPKRSLSVFDYHLLLSNTQYIKEQGVTYGVIYMGYLSDSLKERIISAADDRLEFCLSLKQEAAYNLPPGVTIIPSKRNPKERSKIKVRNSDTGTTKLKKLEGKLSQTLWSAVALFTNPRDNNEQTPVYIAIPFSNHRFDPVKQLVDHAKDSVTWRDHISVLQQEFPEAKIVHLRITEIEKLGSDYVDTQRLLLDNFKKLRKSKGWRKSVYRGIFQLSIDRVNNQLVYSLIFSAVISNLITTEVFHRYTQKTWRKLTGVYSIDPITSVNNENQLVTSNSNGLHYLKTEKGDWNLSLLRKQLVKTPLSGIYGFVNRMVYE